MAIRLHADHGGGKPIDVHQGHTGYTHQWFQEFAADYKGIFMASVDSALEEEMAQSQGWKTFRVYAPDLPIEGAKSCPAQLTDNRVQCERCLLCNGKKANIGIHAHGKAAKQVAGLKPALHRASALQH